MTDISDSINESKLEIIETFSRIQIEEMHHGNKDRFDLKKKKNLIKV